jgi:large subunit ribosomal protein L14e
MFEVGRVCVKIAGRDAGKRCVIVDTLEFPFVMVDGETRRRKTNIRHLLPLDQKIEVKKGAGHEAVAEMVSKAGFTPRVTKPKKAAPRLKRVRKVKPKAPKAAPKKKAAKSTPKKEAPTEEVKKTVTPPVN